MAFSDAYRQQVALLLRTIPAVAAETCFALKGGTAINLFVRDLPRLSVDIDLTYLTLLPRERSLGAIDKAMKRIAARLKKTLPNARITPSTHDNTVTKLLVRDQGVQIKIEVTPVHAAAPLTLKYVGFRKPLKTSSVLPKCKWSRLPISMLAKLWPPSTGSIPATFSM